MANNAPFSNALLPFENRVVNVLKKWTAKATAVGDEGDVVFDRSLDGREHSVLGSWVTATSTETSSSLSATQVDSPSTVTDSDGNTPRTQRESNDDMAPCSLGLAGQKVPGLRLRDAHTPHEVRSIDCSAPVKQQLPYDEPIWPPLSEIPPCPLGLWYEWSHKSSSLEILRQALSEEHFGSLYPGETPAVHD